MKQDIARSIARLISTIFIPPTLTILIFIFLSYEFDYQFNKRFFTIIIALIFGFILQIGMFIYLYRKGILSDVDAKQKTERTLPYYISLIIYVVGFILLLSIKANIVSIAFWFCYISSTFLVILINKYLKISIHAMGVSGPLALLFFLLGIKAFLFMPIVVLVGWSRIKLEVHSLLEVTAGSVFGFILVYLQLLIFLN